MFYLRPLTDGMVPILTERAPHPNAFEIRCRFNRSLSCMAREGINFTQDLVDREMARIRSEVEAEL